MPKPTIKKFFIKKSPHINLHFADIFLLFLKSCADGFVRGCCADTGNIDMVSVTDLIIVIHAVGCLTCNR